MSVVTLLERTVILPVSGIVDVEGAAQQSFSATGGAMTRWSFTLLIDGNLVFNPGGASPLDVVYLGGFQICGAGPRLIRLLWVADPTVTVPKAFLKIRAFPKTQGS